MKLGYVLVFFITVIFSMVWFNSEDWELIPSFFRLLMKWQYNELFYSSQGILHASYACDSRRMNDFWKKLRFYLPVDQVLQSSESLFRRYIKNVPVVVG